jgi:hypothetical protein
MAARTGVDPAIARAVTAIKRAAEEAKGGAAAYQPDGDRFAEGYVHGLIQAQAYIVEAMVAEVTP